MMHYQVYFVLILSAAVSCHCNVLLKDDFEEGPLILTPYVENGETEKAKNLSVVDPSQFAGVNSHAAYFTVNKTNKWHLFFWYFPAEGVPLDSTPLIIWLQGGPGVSSMFGLLNEIGSIQIKDGKAERREITWGSNYSLLFIDNPVGTGFSFTENDDLYVTNEDMVGECLLNFIQQFLQVFPELRKAPLFISGESYAGKYIPAFAHYIHHNNDPPPQSGKNDSMPINLKGLAIGNGWIDPLSLLRYSEYSQQIGLLDARQAFYLYRMEFSVTLCLNFKFMECVYVLEAEMFQYLKTTANLKNAYNYLDDSQYSTEYVDFLNIQEIQDSIHAKRLNYTEWSDPVQRHLIDDIFLTVKPWLEDLLEHYGVMCYSGQLDVKVPYALSVNTHLNLQWSGLEAYLKATREPVYDKNNPQKVNFFIKEVSNFMEVMVRAAGQMVPMDQPRAAKQMIDMFIKRFK